MKIVMDTKTVMSAFFFGGYPRQIIEAVMQGRLTAYATREIVEEYEASLAEIGARKGGRFRHGLVLPFLARLHIVAPQDVPGCDKFIACALAARAVYVVSDGKDLLSMETRRAVTIMTAEGCCQLLPLCVL